MTAKLVELLNEAGFSVLEVSDWKTFDYEEREYGTARIEKSKYKRGLYLMEGVDGYDFFYVTKPIMVTVLKVNGKEVMVDDPLHYYGMKLLAEASEGRVLTAGLGLGIYTIFLQDNPKVESVTVVELNSDVKQLVEPMIQKYIKKPTQIVVDDIINWKKKAKNFNTIMLDIWVTSKPEPNVFREMLRMFSMFKVENPNANVYVWGIREPSINPAVKRLNPNYLEFLKFDFPSQPPSKGGGKRGYEDEIGVTSDDFPISRGEYIMERDLKIIFDRVNEVYWELIDLLRQRHPELVPLYHARYEYTDPKYPLDMRLHNAYQILRTWHQLKFQR